MLHKYYDISSLISIHRIRAAWQYLYGIEFDISDIIKSVIYSHK